MNYFIIINDAQQGPFSVAELQQRGISSETLVWAEGMAEWTPAWQVEELRPLFYKQTAGAAVPPPPPIGHGAGAQEAQPGAPVPPQAPPAGDSAVQDQAAPTLAKPRRNGRWAIIVLVVVAAVLAFTNPSERAHKRAILSNITNGISQLTTNGDNSVFAQGLGAIGSMFANGVVQVVLDQKLEYHNYLFFSTTTLRIGGEDVRASFGILGNVFTADENEVARDLEKAISHDESSDGAASSDAADDDTAQNPDQDVQVQSHEQDTTLTDGTGRAIGRAAVKVVTKTFKQKVNEATDSTTSSAIGQVIDEIEKMLGVN